MDLLYLPNSDLLSGKASGNMNVVKAFEPKRDLLASVDNRAGGATVSKFDYTNDAIGRRTKRLDTLAAAAPVTNTFGYNNRSELTSAKMDDDLFAYIYDNIGNRTIATNQSVKSTYTANNLNEYTQVVAPGNTNAMKFDLDGNLTNDARFAYVWDAENRLTTVTPKSLTNGARRVTMTYDYMSRRTQKVVETRSGSAWINPVTNKFLYDGWNLVEERSDGPTVQPSDCYYMLPTTF